MSATNQAFNTPKINDKEFKNIVEELQARGLIHNSTDLEKIIAEPEGAGLYLGVDPTAPFLHLGNLVAVIIVIHFARYGWDPVMLFGGATGAIGDPREVGERSLLSDETIAHNMKRQKKKIIELFSRLEQEVKFVNNRDWLGSVSILEYLRDVGKHFTINYLIAKDTIKKRIAGSGISFTEFNYTILQAMDFLHLYKEENCKLQVGGSDQWGNLTSGLELIRKKVGGEAHALSCPLLVDSQGKKFGKSEGGALWIDEEGLSPFQLYQFLINVSDQDIEKYLLTFTFLKTSEIKTIVKDSLENPHLRKGQKILAENLVWLLHGEKGVDEAKRSTQVLFGGSFDNLTAEQLTEIFSDIPSASLELDKIKGATVLDLFTNSEIVKSKGEAKRLITGGGAYINNIRVEKTDDIVSESNIIDGKMLVLRAGKKNYRVVRLG